MDELLALLNEVSIILLPIVGLVCLILLALVLFNINITIKKATTSIDGLDDVLTSAKGKINQLEGPLNTLNSVSKTVDTVNDSAVSAVNSAIKFTVKHSDSIMNWGKDTLEKRKESKANRADAKHSDVKTEVNKEEEDFGVYE